MVPGDKCWVMFATYCLEITITQEAKIIHSKKSCPYATLTSLHNIQCCIRYIF